MSEQTEEQFFDLDSMVTDEAKELQGVEFGLPGGGLALVARWGNERFNAAMREEYRANRIVLDQNDAHADKMSEDMVTRLMAKHILKGIKGVKKGGKIYREFSDMTPADALACLKEKNFRAMIKGFAETTEKFKVDTENSAVKS